MAKLKQIKFGNNPATPIAQTQVAIDSESSKALSVSRTNAEVDVDADPLYTLALAVDGKTITKTGNEGLATALKLAYHAAVTTEGSEKGAYIALEDNTGTSIGGSEVMVADIVGNSVLKRASYSETTGKLTLVFATASGTEQTVEIDLGKLLDIDDIIIKETSTDYLSFDTTASESGQATLGVKLADVTYTASTESANANLTVDVTNGKMVDASDAIPAIKSYVDDVVSKEATAREANERVTAEALNNLDARKANASDVLNGVKAGNGIEVGTKDAEGKQTVSVKRDTTSESYLTVGADGIKLSGVGTAITNAIGALDFTDTAVDSQYVSSVSETDGKISVSRTDVSGAKLNNYTKGTDATAIAATDTINQAFSKVENQIDKAKASASTVVAEGTDAGNNMTIAETTDATDGHKTYTINLTDVASASLLGTKEDTSASDTAFGHIALIKGQIASMDKSASAVNGQVVTTVSEANGKVSETKANVKDLQLGGYTKDTTKTGDIAGTDTINDALSKLENKAASIQYQVSGTTLTFFGINPVPAQNS